MLRRRKTPATTRTYRPTAGHELVIDERDKRAIAFVIRFHEPTPEIRILVDPRLMDGGTVENITHHYMDLALDAVEVAYGVRQTRQYRDPPDGLRFNPPLPAPPSIGD